MAIRKIVSRSIGVDVIAAEDLANNSVTAAEIQDGVIGLAKLSATGTKDATTFLRGDNSFQVVDVNDVTGDFTVDTDVLVVDSTNDRVGVNEASPSHPLHIQASAAGETTMKVESNQAGAMNVAFDVDTDRDLVLQMQEAGTTRWDFLMNGSSGTNPLILRNQSGTTIQKFTQEGYVTKPNQPAFMAHMDGGDVNGITPGSVSNLKLSMANTFFNRGSHWDTTNDRFTAPVNGVYQFNYQLYWGFSGGGVRVVHAAVYKNGSTYITLNGNGGINADGGNFYHPTYTHSFMMDLNANDYVEVFISSVAGTFTTASIYAGGQSFFSGYLVG